ncbi:hypothetical protein R1sor_026044 [Riccia sorocarpa]|uniref:RING-type domain-containing protein n=1 Tax=Riccia sorocarpa TaxID=122646 RepID=A0ABD3GBU0_9MARC
MQFDDFDVDALLEAQSSEDEGADLPELERSLDDILNDDEFADVLGHPVIAEGSIQHDLRRISHSDEALSQSRPENLEPRHTSVTDEEKLEVEAKEKSTDNRDLLEFADGKSFPAETSFGLNHKETSDQTREHDEEEKTDAADSRRFVTGLSNLISRESNGQQLSSPSTLGSLTAGGSSSTKGRPGAALAAAAAASRQTSFSDSAALKFAKTFSTRQRRLFSATSDSQNDAGFSRETEEHGSEDSVVTLKLPQDEEYGNKVKPSEDFDIKEEIVGEEVAKDEIYATIEECLDRVEILSSKVEILEQENPDFSSRSSPSDANQEHDHAEEQSNLLLDVNSNSSSEDSSETDEATDRSGPEQIVVPQHTQPESSHANIAVNNLIEEEEETSSPAAHGLNFSAFKSTSSLRSVTDSDEEEEELSKEDVEEQAENVAVIKSEEPVEDETPRTTLQLAEESEKRAASSGLHWEEGAVAQPMRLEGIQRGAPAIGLLQLDSGGALNYALKNTDLRRDHGSPQALAVHNNFIAIGMAKGPVLIIPSKYSATKSADETDAKPYILIPPASEKHQMAASSMSFNQQGDLLLVGYSSGHIILWDVVKATVGKHIERENGPPIVHAVFVGQDAAASRTIRAITADSRGLTLLHSFTQIPFVRRFSHNNAVLLDGQRTGLVLSISPLLLDEEAHSTGGSNVTPSGSSSPLNLGTVMSVVGGSANGDVGRKFLYDGASPGEEGGGLVVLATYQTALVVKLLPSLVVCAKFTRPDGIRDGAVPYTAWRRTKGVGAGPASGSASLSSSSAESSQNTPPRNTEGRPVENGHNRDDGAHEAGTAKMSSEGGENSPVLAMAWDKKVIILQLLKTQLKIIAQWELDSPAVGVAWLEQEMVVVTTSKDELCLYTSEGVEIERAALSHDHSGLGAVTYHTHFLNIYGNPEKAYHNSLAVRGAALYVLGPSQLWRARLLPWQDRIKALQNAGDSLGAFHIAMEIYDGRSQGVTGLPRGLDAMRDAIMPTLLSLLSSYIDEAFAYLSLAFGSSSSPAASESGTALASSAKSGHTTVGMEGPGEAKHSVEETAVEVREQYARVGGVAIEFCVHIHKTDVLFENVFSKFDAVGQRGTFLELLEPYILKDMLGGLAPEVMQALVEHYSSRGWLNRVEQCVLHMDIASLDFNQVVRVCRDHGLYSALIYLFTKGLDDFRSPLEELLAVAQHSDDPQLARAYGLKLLVYVKYCFSGLAFPPGNGTLSPVRLPQLRTELLEYLLDSTDTTNKNKKKITKETADPEGLKYPRLLYLLTLDTQATLQVLGAAFPEDGPLGVGKRECVYPLVRTKSEEEALKTLAASEGTFPNEESIAEGLRLAQMTVDAVTHVLQTVDPISLASELEETGERWPSEEQIGEMFEFVAFFAAGRYAVVPGPVLARIFEYLTSAVSEKSETLEARKVVEVSKQREELMLAVLKAVPKADWDGKRTLELAQRSRFWQVTALLHAERGDLTAALESYLKDVSRPEDAFVFISDKLSAEKGLEGSILTGFRECVLSHIPELIQLSPVSTIVMVLRHFSRENQHILNALAPHPRLLFSYMKAIMNIRSGGLAYSESTIKENIRQRQHGQTSGESRLPSSGGHPGEGRVSHSLAESQSYLADLLERSGLEFTDEMAEDFVELLCRFEPKSVLSFLESYENYRLEHCLRLCQEYGITDAAIFLLERVGDVASALALVLANVQMLLEDMDHALATTLSSPAPSKEIQRLKDEKLKKLPEVKAVDSVLRAAIALCQRNTFRLEPRESETLWFRLLDRFVEPLRDINLQLRDSRARSERVVSSNKSGFRWKVLENDLAVQAVRDLLVQYIGDIVNGMMSFVPISVTMSKILEEHGEHEFGDFKVTILDMLSAYGYERAILGTANKLIEDDTFQNVYALRRGCSHAFIPSTNVCSVCSLSLDEPVDSYRSTSAGSSSTEVNNKKQKGKIDDEPVNSSSAENRSRVRIFPCGHATHYHCMDAVDSGSGKRNASVSVLCPICAFKPVDVARKANDATLLKDTVVEVGGRKASDRDSSVLSKFGRMHKTTSRTFGRSRLEILRLLERGTDLHELGPSVELSLAPPVVTPYKRPPPPLPASGGSTGSSGRSSSRSNLTAAVLSMQRKNKSRAR